jgi:1-acyl-sn-glycerol-3-phosphate acyltransferase
VIRLAFCIVVWILSALVAAVGGFPVLYLTGSIEVLWNLSLWAARNGYTLAGIRVRAVGREQLEAGRAYLFISNHVSNLDPPLITPLLGRRVAIIAKQELFKIPLFGRAMKKGSFVAVNRAARRSAVESVTNAVHVLQSGLGMLVFPEGTRSPDGKLLTFKKGPFQLAKEAGVPVVPITVVGTYEAWPKGSWKLRAGEVVVYFHPPVDPKDFATKEDLLAAVRATIESALPEAQRRTATAQPPRDVSRAQ